MGRLGRQVLAGAAAFAFTAAVAAANEAVRVNVSTLNVRTGPSTGYGEIGEVHSGQIYVSIATSGSWRKIWFDHRTGWVHGSYVSVVSATKIRVTASSLNVRTGPGTGYSDVGDAPRDSWWAVAGTSGDWKKVWYRGAERWMHGAYLSTSAGGSTPPPSGTSSTNPYGLPRSYVGYLQLPASGSGFYCYSSSTRRWGTSRMINGMIRAFSSWRSEHSSYPRIGVGDISDYNGGYLSGHASHQRGVDADMRPVASSGYEGPLTRWSGSYSSYRTDHFFTHHLRPNLSINVIFFNDPAIYNRYSWVQYWSNHDNHFHVRIY